MSNPYISAILAITSLSFSEELIAQTITKHEYCTVKKYSTPKYQSDKNNYKLNAKLAGKSSYDISYASNG
jgi:hypothetical protein